MSDLKLTALLSEKDIFRPSGGKVEGSATSYSDLDVMLVHDENATIAVLTIQEGASSVEFTGSSKRLPGDPRNRAAAEQIALGRALLKAGSALFAAGYRNAG